MDAICPSVIDSLVHIWTTLHNDLDVEIDAAEARYLRGVLFGMDDELVARLLAAKLAISRTPDPGGADDLARRGSFVSYAVQGQSLSARLVHGSLSEDGLLGVGSRFGAALLGLRPGQSLLWPMEHGRLVEVRALRVGAVPGGRPVRPVIPVKVPRLPCAFG